MHRHDRREGAAHRRRLLVAGMALATAALAVGCSEKPQPGPPTEQEIHASDRGMTNGPVGRHPFRCDDGKPLFVDFKDSGLQIELRDAIDGPATTLSAPTQGLQYVGDRSSATLTGSTIAIIRDDGQKRVCVREGSR